MSEAFERAIAAFEPAQWPLAVGFSGGADSTALLAACASRWPGQVVAFHVHHGLQTAADDFERHCGEVCERLAVPLIVHRVDARHAPGDSPEDTARRARYEAFGAMARMDSTRPFIQSIALGHHADDQVETLLLALSRGAGLPGLAAMPAHAERNGLNIYRPLLTVPAADIRAWLAARDLPWIEDPSNGDARYTRNRIRAVLLPALEQAFPQFRATFARSIGHAAQAQQLLLELAAQDLEAVGNPPLIKALQALSRARQANVARHWLMQSHGCAPSAAQLDQLLDQVRACTTRGHRIHLKVAGGFAERKGDRLHWYNAPPSPKT
ncbi:tRNA(Ile)-lysidine synthase [Variovorax boronicumulans]|uniref:tRNA(Ile)-lysidine synthase n=1 Tax=Variovorax boronicumulans TaxID=436515 RepID=A0AAW8D1P9_9BURK|nr:tRNA lysidine(34) synthetase TilS [Variovorax boronicumulans]MDP9893771.1 tRNA(Ile)-lysidine synthase [Variovorax boronicumulans]MDQ0039350.1 tRNA(Ile)-lysidine synthase [Variovorax boronicumulans]MDQ0053588.1 tRNA(Ile)-lysidine synthase [Variovorax boronicumulans]